MLAPLHFPTLSFLHDLGIKYIRQSGDDFPRVEERYPNLRKQMHFAGSDPGFAFTNFNILSSLPPLYLIFLIIIRKQIIRAINNINYVFYMKIQPIFMN